MGTLYLDLRGGAPRRRLGKKKIRDGKGEGVEEGRREKAAR